MEDRHKTFALLPRRIGVRVRGFMESFRLSVLRSRAGRLDVKGNCTESLNETALVTILGCVVPDYERLIVTA